MIYGCHEDCASNLQDVRLERRDYGCVPCGDG